MILSILIFLSILLCMFSTILSEELVELNSRNMITIRGPINHESVSDFMLKSGKVDSEDLYIYISSPGGSVMEGMKIVDLIKSLEKSGKNISCISDFSASMAFIILQSCPRRLATFSSVLMQHQASLNVDGPIRNVESRLNFVTSLENQTPKKDNLLGLGNQAIYYYDIFFVDSSPLPPAHWRFMKT